MVNPRLLGFDTSLKRNIYLLGLDTLDTEYGWPDGANRHFVCLSVWDSSAATVDEVGSFCRRLLDLGCAYLCTWGPGCERVHDIMDEVIVGDGSLESYRGLVMTTWHPHSDWSLEETLDFLLDDTRPAEEFAPDGCAFSMLIRIGSHEWDGTVETYIQSRISC
jgi:hypothetical protein